MAVRESGSAFEDLVPIDGRRFPNQSSDVEMRRFVVAGTIRRAARMVRVDDGAAVGIDPAGFDVPVTDLARSVLRQVIDTVCRVPAQLADVRAVMQDEVSRVVHLPEIRGLRVAVQVALADVRFDAHPFDAEVHGRIAQAVDFFDLPTFLFVQVRRARTRKFPGRSVHRGAAAEEGLDDLETGDFERGAELLLPLRFRSLVDLSFVRGAVGVRDVDVAQKRGVARMNPFCAGSHHRGVTGDAEIVRGEAVLGERLFDVVPAGGVLGDFPVGKLPGAGAQSEAIERAGDTPTQRIEVETGELQADQVESTRTSGNCHLWSPQVSRNERAALDSGEDVGAEVV